MGRHEDDSDLVRLADEEYLRELERVSDTSDIEARVAASSVPIVHSVADPVANALDRIAGGVAVIAVLLAMGACVTWCTSVYSEKATRLVEESRPRPLVLGCENQGTYVTLDRPRTMLYVEACSSWSAWVRPPDGRWMECRPQDGELRMQYRMQYGPRVEMQEMPLHPETGYPYDAGRAARFRVIGNRAVHMNCTIY